MSALPSAAVTTPELVWLDPKALTSHPDNVRFDLRNLDELAESIAESGIVEPLVVVPLEDGHRILAGHRRAAAAIRAGLEVVPCWLRPDLAGVEPDQLATALAENLQRDALTIIEEAHAYAQLAAFPTWSAARIAKAAGRSVDQVQRGIEATKLPQQLQEPAAAGKLSLDEARELEEFADDNVTYRRLLRHAGERNFSYLLHQARRDRAINRRLDENRAALEEAGVPIIARPSHNGVELRLKDLYDSEGEELDEHNHACCPGHAAYLDAYRGDAVYVCTDPLANRHSTPPWYRHLTDEEAAALVAEDEAAEARAAELEVAAEVRRAFIRERVGAKGKPPAGTLRFVTETLLDGDIVDLADGEDIAWYVGHDDPKNIDVDDALAVALRKTTDARLPFLLLAVAAAVSEANVAGHSNRWRYSPAAAVRWFGFLERLGYARTDAEDHLYDQARTAVMGADDDEAAQ